MKYEREAQDNFEKSEGKRQEVARQKLVERAELVKRSQAAMHQLTAAMEANNESNDRAVLVRAQLSILKAGLTEQLKAQKQYLDANEQQELNALNRLYSQKKITDQEYQAAKALLEENYRQQGIDAEFKYYEQLIQFGLQFLSQLSNIVDSSNSAKTAKENNELARDQEINTKKKQQYQKQLDAKLISQAEYDRAIEALDNKQAEKARAIKLKQFKRDQNAAVIKANIQIAQAVLEALASAPPLSTIFWPAQWQRRVLCNYCRLKTRSRRNSVKVAVLEGLGTAQSIRACRLQTL